MIYDAGDGEVTREEVQRILCWVLRVVITRQATPTQPNNTTSNDCS